MMKRMGRVLLLGCFLLALVAMGLAVFLSLAREENGRQLLGYRFMLVTGNSMSRSDDAADEKVFFDAGDMILIKEVKEPSDLKEGDVITFVSSSAESYGQTVTHKIREILYSQNGKVAGYVTYGIYTGANDSAPAKPEAVMGRYVCKVARAGGVISFLTSPRGYYLGIVIPLSLLIAFFSMRLGRMVTERRLEEEHTLEVLELRRKIRSLEEELARANADSLLLSEASRRRGWWSR